MSRPRGPHRSLCCILLGWPALLSAQAQAESPRASFQTCAAIAGPGARLACYDELAGRAAGPPQARSPAEAGAVGSPKPVQSFGLYAAEHPHAQNAALSARVVSVMPGANGRSRVELEGGQLWELDGPDALVTNGDLVTIRRAALGSFLMTTAQAQTHRVRRLR